MYVLENKMIFTLSNTVQVLTANELVDSIQLILSIKHKIVGYVIKNIGKSDNSLLKIQLDEFH